ncbi:unnamed protein product, partial [Didymodactylos carnosus]
MISEIWKKWRSIRLLAVIMVFLAFFMDWFLTSFIAHLEKLQQYLTNITNCTTPNSWLYNWTINATFYDNLKKKMYIAKEDVPIGLLLGSKTFVQLIANPLAANLIG